jgi:hypothetical protein
VPFQGHFGVGRLGPAHELAKQTFNKAVGLRIGPDLDAAALGRKVLFGNRDGVNPLGRGSCWLRSSGRPKRAEVVIPFLIRLMKTKHRRDEKCTFVRF